MAQVSELVFVALQKLPRRQNWRDKLKWGHILAPNLLLLAHIQAFASQLANHCIRCWPRAMCLCLQRNWSSSASIWKRREVSRHMTLLLLSALELSVFLKTWTKLPEQINLALKTYYSVREDEKINFFSSLAYELLPMTSLKAKYDFFDNGSTVSQYDFNQHQIGFHLVGDYF